MPSYSDYTDNFTRPIIDPPGAREGMVDTSTIKTATGKALRTDYVTFPSDTNYGYIRILGSDFATVAQIFSDPTEVAILEYGPYKISGYSMNYCQHDGDAIKIFMVKEA